MQKYPHYRELIHTSSKKNSYLLQIPQNIICIHGIEIKAVIETSNWTLVEFFSLFFNVLMKMHIHYSIKHLIF